MQAPKHFKPTPFHYHEVVELTIDTLTNLGLGLGRINNWVVMVPFALAGERVRVRIYKNHKNYSEGDLLEVIEASPHRVKPRCPLFGTCGGCQYQHLSYEEQLKHKQKQVEELFKHLAKVEIHAKPTLASPKVYHYRSKLTPHFPKPELKRTSPVQGLNTSSPRGDDAAPSPATFPIGFLRQGNRFKLIDVPQCPIASEAINEALPSIRETILKKASSYKQGGTLLLRDSQDGICTDPKALLKTTLNTPSGKLDYQFVAGDFFQNNPYILEDLIRYTLTQASALGLPYLLDAYCGVGVFALAASGLFKAVMGVEVNPKAIELAKHNASLNGIDNCQFIQGQAEAIFERVPYLGSELVMIIDPPRKGCDTPFLEQLVHLKPKRIVYISCAPDTQARDLAYLLQHAYSIQEVQPFDLFPQTRHIENVMVLDYQGPI